MNKYKWHFRAVCPCGWHIEAPFGSLFHVHVDCCPECGRYKGGFCDVSERWRIATMKFVPIYPKFSWWNPITWFGRGEWVEMNEEQA